MGRCKGCDGPTSRTGALCRGCFLDPRVRRRFPGKTNSRSRDITGGVYGRLAVESFAGVDKFGKRTWHCRCACGNRTVVATGALTTGNTTSCGCYKLQATGDAHRTHGMCKSAEYRIWCLMRSRCGDPASRDYANYGGRGITVHPAWRESFVAFLADVGRRPTPKHSLDRIDNDKGYEPGNVRWADQKTQCRNKSANRLVTVNGETRCVAEWAELTGIDQRMIARRLDRGMAPERAVALPPRRNIADPTAEDELRRHHLLWWAMCDRCRNPANEAYPRYGGRGIAVCDRWSGPEGFAHFIADMGYRPTPKHTLDRIDQNGLYAPENCRWATGKEQARNTSRNRMLTHNGETLCISAWAERLGVPPYLLSMRLNRHGWSVERALTTPRRKR